MMVMGTLSIMLCNPKMKEFHGCKPILMCSFGNIDLLKSFNNIIQEMGKDLDRKKIKNQLLDDFHRCSIKLKPCKEAIQARKEWLTSNSRCSEILDSEFYNQMLPSLDICLYEISNQWLKERNIPPCKIMKPDWRYLNCVSIGFTSPQVSDVNHWRQKYGQSKGVPKDESHLIGYHKTLSVGKVKSYGSNTCIQSSVGQGA